MEISGSSINQKVSFYTKNTGNNINMAIDEDNRPFLDNVFSPEINEQLKNKNQTKPIKRRKKGKRLNTIDSDYLPDEVVENSECDNKEADNFFIEAEERKMQYNIKRAFSYFFENIPLINYCYLKQKEKKIQKAVEKLKDINQNVDDILNSAVPYGEESEHYSTYERSLKDAANVIGQAKKIF